MLEKSLSGLEYEVARYNLSEVEQDALSHYPKNPSIKLIRELRGNILVFQNILYDIWIRGMRLRIVPQGTKLTDLPECTDLKVYKDEHGNNVHDSDSVGGLYRHEKKLMVVKEEELHKRPYINQKGRAFVHEFAHGIWNLLISDYDKQYLLDLYMKEKGRRGESTEEYRMKDVLEFFAEGFAYYITPYRKSRVLGVNQHISKFGNIPIIEIERENVTANVETLKRFNVELFMWMHNKFKGLIDPELVMPRPVGEGELETFDLWGENGIYLPVIDLGVLNWKSVEQDIKSPQHIKK